MERQKIDFYFTRTLQHIHRVHNNMLTVVTKFRDVLRLNDEECRQLIYNVINHDRSKFGTVQFYPYIELTEYYRQKKTLGNTTYTYPTSDIRNAVDAAVLNHYYVENHHPERIVYEGELVEDGIISPDLAFTMSYLEIIEVCCDLTAVAQEHGEISARGYWKDVWWPKHSDIFGENIEDVRHLMMTVITLFERNT